MGAKSKAEALELKYADTTGNRSSYRKSLAASGKTSEQIPMVTRMATGGSAVGTDTVPSLLTPGEFVVNKRSAQAFGYGNLRKINKYAKGGTVQHFANGDTVQPSQGSLFGGFSFAGLKREVGQVTSSFRIFNKDVKTGSKLYKRAVAHESLHAKELAEGKIDYGKDYIRDGNKTYHRQTRKGKDMVKYNGNWVEVGTSSGPNALPWEKRAVEAEKNA